MSRQTVKGSHHQRRASAILFHLPRSIDEAEEIARQIPDRLGEKARQRLEKLPGQDGTTGPDSLGEDYATDRDDL